MKNICINVCNVARYIANPKNSPFLKYWDPIELPYILIQFNVFTFRFWFYSIII